MKAAAVLARLFTDRRGIALVEMAVGISILVPVVMATAELARFIMIQQKLERLAMTIGDLNARGDVLTQAQVTSLFDAVPHIMSPFNFAPAGRVIVSRVTTVGTVYPEIAWQQTGGGTLAVSSALGTAGHTATLPADFDMVANENVIMTEVIYDFAPFMFDGLLQPQRLRMQSTYRPRM